MFNGLDICAGSGIGSLAFERAGLSRTVCYIERDPYCQRVIQQRQRDGWLSPAPVWDDLRTFDGRPWRGCVDFIFGGIPCQPWSLAGKQQGAADERDLWGEFRRVLGEVGPRFALVENVPGLLSSRRNACVCGGFDGRRRLYRDIGVKQVWKLLLLPGSRHRHVETRDTCYGQDAGMVWRESEQTPGRNDAMAVGIRLAYLGGRRDGIRPTNLPISDSEAPTCDSGREVCRSARANPEGWQAQAMDGRDALTSTFLAEADAGIEQAWADGVFGVDGDGRCSVCGGAVGETADVPGWNFGAIQRDLAELGYSCSWCVISAADVGALHLRKRVWIVAYANIP